MNQVAIEIGELLRSTRTSRGVSVDDASLALKIRMKYLIALEEGNSAEQPSAVYLLGYLKSYADYLGLDSDQVVERFKSEKENAPHRPELYLPEPYRKDFHPRPAALLLSIVLVLGIYSIWHQYHKEGGLIKSPVRAISEALSMSTYNATPQVAATKKAPAPTARPYPASLPTPTIATYKETKAEGNSIVLLAKSSTWVKIMDRNSRLLSEHMLNAGDTYFVTDEKGIVITAGNPEAIDVMQDGQLNQLNTMGLQQAASRGKILGGRFMSAVER